MPGSEVVAMHPVAELAVEVGRCPPILEQRQGRSQVHELFRLGRAPYQFRCVSAVNAGVIAELETVLPASGIA